MRGDGVKEHNSGRIHVNAVGGGNNFQELHMRKAGVDERVEPLNIYFIYLHTAQEGDSTARDGHLQHKGDYI